MKKLIFTLMMMAILAFVNNTAWGQTNTSPYANGTTMYSYTWSNIEPIATTHEFFVLDAVPTPTPSASTATATDFSIASGVNAPTASGGTATVNITWNNDAANGTYYLAFVATNSSCTNFRYVQIDPVDPVDFTIFAVGVSGDADGSDLTLSSGNSDGGSSCAPEIRVGADYLSGSGTENDGTVYVFFRVERNNGTTTNDWTADITVTGTTTSIQYSPDGTNWDGSMVNDDDTDVLYIRAEIDVPTNVTSATISSSIAQATTFESVPTVGNVADYDGTNNGPKAYTVLPVPSIGAFN